MTIVCLNVTFMLKICMLICRKLVKINYTLKFWVFKSKGRPFVLTLSPLQMNIPFMATTTSSNFVFIYMNFSSQYVDSHFTIDGLLCEFLFRFYFPFDSQLHCVVLLWDFSFSMFIWFWVIRMGHFRLEEPFAYSLHYWVRYLTCYLSAIKHIF